MESGLTPREIQERIRAGQSLDEVTEVAGMPRDRVERFALAVFDERRHMADQAREHSVRRTGESGSHRLLGEVVSGWFERHQVDPDTVSWDATRGDDRHFWTVTVRWGTEQDLATFGYDVRGTFAVAEDDAARELIDDDGTPIAVPDDAEAGAGDSDDEPTLNYADQFAIVNVIQEDEPVLSEDEQPEHRAAGPFDLQDIVPTPESELDALYAMLRGHQEDSVTIYAGLSESEPERPPSSRRRRHRRRNEEPDEPAADDSNVEHPDTEPSDPQQPSLIEDEDPAPPSRPKRRARKRAAVPTWDEIMFGGPDKE